MCGITGFIHLDSTRQAQKYRLKPMTDSLLHRGPDGDGFFVDKQCGLGHRRLSIIDLSGGSQPMTFGSTTIVFNGEIYNYKELRHQLELLGYTFTTSSDTEVILHSYNYWKEHCVEYFNGMWAFALWDSTSETLFCSRDRIGEKPLYYCIWDKTFVFGSEIKALAAYGVPLRMRSDMLNVYLCLTYIPAPYSFFHGVSKLEPGSSLVVKNGTVTSYKYWSMPVVLPNDQRHDTHNIQQEFIELLSSSVALRMISDVPFGAFLSGGLDSASIVSLMSQISSQPVETFTIGFPQKEYDERHLAQDVAQKFATHHHEFEVTADDLSTILQRLAHHFDEPFGDSSALPTYIVSGLARKHVTMVLTGDGGDEVLSGYTIHQGEKFAETWNTYPKILRNMVLSVVGTLASVPLGVAQKTLRRSHKVLQSSNVDISQRILEKQTGFTNAERTALLRFSNSATSSQVVSPEDIVSDALSATQGSNSFGKLNHWLRTISLPDDMLCKVDRASMAQSIETRVPFLDYRLVELLSSVHKDVLLNGYTRKVLLRNTVGTTLPQSLLHAKKQGFVVPLSDWVRSNESSTLEHYARQLSTKDIINAQALDTIFRENTIGKRDAGNALWTLAMLSIALEKYELE